MTADHSGRVHPPARISKRLTLKHNHMEYTMEHHRFGNFEILSTKEAGKYRYRVRDNDRGETLKSFPTCGKAVRYIRERVEWAN